MNIATPRFMSPEKCERFFECKPLQKGRWEVRFSDSRGGYIGDMVAAGGETYVGIESGSTELRLRYLGH